MPGGYSFLGDFRVEESGGEVVSQSIGPKALKATAADQSTLEVNTSTGALQVAEQGAALSNGVQRNRMSKYTGTWLQGSLAVSASVAGVFQLTNTYSVDLIVTDVLIHITTAAADDGREIDIGVGSASGTSYANLIDGLSLTTTGAFSNAHDEGTGGGIAVWKAGEYVNASASAVPTSLVGFYAVHVIDISA
tara:strand:- start:7899 stop:8474 length:576 start_codon:yes stop_codon:yes gene_type:complete